MSADRAVWIERRQRPATLNELLAMTRHPRRKHILDWRRWAQDEAVDQCLAPISGPVTVTAQLYRPDARSMPDAGSAILAVKAMLDGLVDAHVLPGDGPAVVRSTTCEAPVVAGYDGLRLIVRPIEEHAIKDQPAPSTGPIPLLPQPSTGECT